MKTKIFAAMIAALVMLVVLPEANAQKPFTHTVASGRAITAADTITMNLVENGVKQFQYIYTETSGTTAGKVYLEGNFLGSTWVKLDSITLTDVGTAQTLRVILTATTYKNYRFVNTNTSSAVATVDAGYLRRPED
jgi:hypothetical protein